MSILGSAEYTATLALEPASLATAFISINPDVISGISSSNNFFNNPSCFLEITILGNLLVFSTSAKNTLSLSPTL